MINVNNTALENKKFIDLFCGIGGFHLALSSFGAECVFASDIDPYACNIYEKNFHINPQGDITKIKATQIPDHDILCAGFPCQPYSISGNMQGLDDSQGRGKLFYDIIRIARAKKPKIILLENVKNLLYHDSGKTFTHMREKLSEVGYKTFFKVMKATDYGIPQARERLYIVAIQKRYRVKEFIFPEPLDDFNVLNDILIEPDISFDVSIKAEYIIGKPELMERSKQLIKIGRTGLGRQGERIYSIYGQACTLSSQGGGPAGKTGMYYINNNVRKLYPRECARLMGFPDSFITAEMLSQCYKQFGNSVVVDIIQYIIIELLNQLGEI